jgi:hypothetical protein
MTRRILPVLGALVLGTACLLLSAGPALTASTGTVNVTVSVAEPCVTIGGGTAVDFGTKPFWASATLAPIGYTAQPYLTIQNCGGGAEKIYARGTDAAGLNGPSWALSDTYYGSICPAVGPNVYSLAIRTGNPANVFTSLSKTNKQLPLDTGGISDWGAGYSQIDALELYMPCTGSSGAGATMAMQVTYTASF